MYALTRRSKLSLLATVPPFALNILHAGTHTLCGPLDVFVSGRLPTTRFSTDISGLAFVRRNPLHFPLSRGILALAVCLSRRRIDLRLVFWNTELFRNNHTSVNAHCGTLVWRPVWISASSRKLQHARFCRRAGSRRRRLGYTYIRKRI